MRTISLLTVAVLAAATPALAQQKTSLDPAKIEAAIKASWPKASDEWKSRLMHDDTMNSCSQTHNNPTPAMAEAIKAREHKRIEYPAGDALLGDWKKGEALAQSGYGLRSTDYPPTRVNGGNCYACHQLTRQEVSFGTIGPSLLEYGKLRKYAVADVKATYEKIYNASAAFPCSHMPRFGTNKVLTIDQIRDLVALLMSPDSPVNKGQ